MKIGVTIEAVGSTLQALQSTHDRLHKATVFTINRIAARVRSETVAQMRVRFDRPTPFVLRSMYIKSAKLEEVAPSAAVYLKDDSLRNPMSKILGHQFSGGHRWAKRFEQALRRMRYLKADEFVAPGPDAKLDAYGNQSRGQIAQIMAALSLFQDHYQNATRSRRSRRNAERAGNIFWSLGKGIPNGNRLQRRCWARGARGSAPKWLLVVIKNPTYKRRITLPEIKDRVVSGEWNAAFSEMLGKVKT